MAENSGSKESVEKPEDTPPVEQDTSAEQPVSVEQPEISRDARMWAMICHLAGLAGFIVPVIGFVVGPLILWQLKKEDDTFIDEQGKEAVNFQISMLIYGVASVMLILCGIGVVLVPVVGIVDLIFLLIAAVKANDGKHYRYPLTIRFIK